MTIKFDGLTVQEAKYADAVAELFKGNNGVITQQDRATLRNLASELGVSTVRAFSIEKQTKDEVSRIMAEQKAVAERKAEEARLRKEREEKRRREEQEARIAEEKRIEKERKEEEKRKASELHQKELREERERQERLEKKRKEELRKAKAEEERKQHEEEEAIERANYRETLVYTMTPVVISLVLNLVLVFWLGWYKYGGLGAAWAMAYIVFHKQIAKKIGHVTSFDELNIDKNMWLALPGSMAALGFIAHFAIWCWQCVKGWLA